MSNWKADSLPGFEAKTLTFPDDYDGAVVATLVRRKATIPTRKAILHVHGYVDYFFQTHFAEECNRQGYNFYALDLRKYGRSQGDSPHPTFAKDLREYFPEITESLRFMAEEDGNETIVLAGHSTGGLTASLYADSGEQRERINALYLNSPFFDFNFTGLTRLLVLVLAFLGRFFPFLALRGDKPVPYLQSIHKGHHGEWDFDLRWRPLNGVPIFAGWLRAVRMGHQRVRQGLSIQCPVLVMHSDKSVYGAQWDDSFQAGDAVLNVVHIREGSRHLGKNVKVVEIKDGLHDLFLSRADVRAMVFSELFGWLTSLKTSVGEKVAE